MKGTSTPTWQVSSVLGVLVWVVLSSFLGLTRICRSLLQPWVSRRVAVDVPLILRVQNLQHEFLDNFFSVLSFVVSVPFYTGFLPLLFWASGHGKLARQTTLLVAFCDYLGNAQTSTKQSPWQMKCVNDIWNEYDCSNVNLFVIILTISNRFDRICYQFLGPVVHLLGE